MIVKSISVKGTPCFGKLLDYIAGPERAGELCSESGGLLHNLYTAESEDLAVIEREFLDNYRYTKPRKNQTVCFHEILSLAREDPDHPPGPILEDLARAYLAIRAPDTIAFARVHHTKHPHIHILISGNEIESSKKLRISKSRFATIKKQLERYQQRQYPFLSHSLVQESQGKRRLTGRKAEIAEEVAGMLHVAGSQKDFEQRLNTAGYGWYEHGKGRGIVAGGRKYRLKTLYLDVAYETRQTQWERAQAIEKDLWVPMLERKKEQIRRQELEI